MDRFRMTLFLAGLTIMLFCLPAGVAARDIRILMLGDSLTSGLGVMPEQAWPALVQQRLDQDGESPAGTVRVINGGISGSTSASAPSRVKWYLKSPPDIMVLALGANDGLRGLSVARMRQNLDQAIQMAKGAGIRVILAGMQIPPNLGPAYTKAFSKVFPDLAAAHDLPLIPFILKGVAGRPELNQADGIHPNVRGHRIVADTVFPYIEEAL